MSSSLLCRLTLAALQLHLLGATSTQVQVRASFVRGRGMAGLESLLGSSSAIFGFRDTCNSLSWFGFNEVAECRDSASPLQDTNCRCQRGGTAWPSKFCTTAGGDPEEAINAAMNVSVRGVPAPDDADYNDVMAMFADEVFGSCDSCCFRAHYVGFKALVVPLALLVCCIGCCWSALVVSQRVASLSAKNAEQQQMMEDLKQREQERLQQATLQDGEAKLPSKEGQAQEAGAAAEDAANNAAASQEEGGVRS